MLGSLAATVQTAALPTAHANKMLCQRHNTQAPVSFCPTTLLALLTVSAPQEFAESTHPLGFK